MTDKCLFCGEVIPKGRMICPSCNQKYSVNEHAVAKSLKWLSNQFPAQRQAQKREDIICNMIHNYAEAGAVALAKVIELNEHIRQTYYDKSTIKIISTAAANEAVKQFAAEVIAAISKSTENDVIYNRNAIRRECISIIRKEAEKWKP